MPSDDTIPQNTEGTEILTLSITPQSTTNLLYIIFEACVEIGSATGSMQAALFQDSTLNALTAVRGCAYSYDCLDLRYIMAAGTTSSTTFKVRVGPNDNTCYVNGSSGGRVFGGVASTSLVIKELVT